MVFKGNTHSCIQKPYWEDHYDYARGKKKSPLLHVKAAECRHALGYFVELLEKYHAALDAASCPSSILLAAGHHLQEFYKIMATEPKNMSAEASTSLERHTLAFLELWKNAKGALRPKHHLMVHLAQEAAASGNPRHYHTYVDEALTRTLSHWHRAPMYVASAHAA